MIVYTVERHVAWEFGEIYDIFDSREKAENVLKKLQDQEIEDYGKIIHIDEYNINNYDVQ